MKKIEVASFLDKRYRFDNCENWDFCGYRCNERLQDELTNILVALDVNDLTINEAIAKNCNLIVSHHPIFFDKESDYIVDKQNINLISKLRENKILNITLHTCFDRDKFGTSYQIMKKIEKILKITSFKQEKYLVFCELSQALTFKKFLKKLRKTYFSGIRYMEPNSKKIIKTICIGAGSCSSMIEDVIGKCDCFLTGDVKWHKYLDAYNCGLSVIDINHDTENVFFDAIKEEINKKFKNIKVFTTKSNLKIYTLI
ncbi:MAG: Nif3-like dinuclear metal center hexameric protein [Ureaplasma sp.]|nr:Nif3-like dinuclear metal center hexameric protein [Ureaplasma sp.]MDE7221922.1 Nif3-like dinuclear metal center hexameric protein [Ureaplasma sp.]